MKTINKNQYGTILFVVITFVFITELLFLLIFKIYFSSEEIIKNHILNKREYNKYLEPNSLLIDNIKIFPKSTKENIDFNKIFNDKPFTCKDKKSIYSMVDFVSSKFCNLTNLKYDSYIGNIISKNNLLLNSPILFATGNVLINDTLILQNNISLIFSLGDIEIKNIVGQDSNLIYFVYLESGTKNINVQNGLNVKIINETPFIIKSIFPQYEKNVLYIK